MTKTTNFTDLIASSHRQRAELEHRVQRLAFELRDEIEELTGIAWRVDSDVGTGFILVMKCTPPAKEGART